MRQLTATNCASTNKQTTYFFGEMPSCHLRLLQNSLLCEYDIRYEQSCECCIDWYLENGHLEETVETDCSWEGHILYVDNVAIIEFICFGENADSGGMDVRG
jgi:hypothetical protein